jgi:uncharacterized protein YqjF (DUF2071 family)
MRPFLTAEWRHLVMLNYRVPPALLQPYVPRGTELDTWQGITYASVVGFLFQRTRVLGVPVPLHRDFEEVNLRFYVRHVTPGGEVRRGVTFIRELVPRAAIATIARLGYNEPYVAVPMRHHLGPRTADTGTFSRVEYGWKSGGTWNAVAVEPSGPGAALVAGSLEEFITEHYWGYTAQRDGGTIEYRVEHPSWRVWQAGAASLTGDHRRLYGDALAAAIAGPPDSAFLAEGSAISVSLPRRL